MAQHDYSIANQSGAAFRADLNNALSAIVSQNSGAAEPSTTFAYQLWADTTAGVLKIRNAANSAWITLNELDGTLTMEAGSAGSPGIYVRGDTNTGVFSSGTDEMALATGGVQRLTVDSSGRLLVGHTASVSTGSQFQARASTDGLAGELIYSGDNANGAYLTLRKTRGTASSPTEVQNLDDLGGIVFGGYDGAIYRSGAFIIAFADGSWTDAGDTTDNPTGLYFSTTADGANSPTQRLRIASDGQLSAVVPGNSTLYPGFMARAWVNFNGSGTVAIRANGNVSSITDNGVGSYYINFTTAMPDTNYGVLAGAGNNEVETFYVGPDTSSRAYFSVYDPVGLVYVDSPILSVAIFR